MVNTLNIHSSTRPYQLFVGINSRELALTNRPERKTAVISDACVAQLYGAEIVQKLSSPHTAIKLFTFPAGEASKTREVLHSLQDQLLDWKIDRQTLLIALGGGVTTDLVGFLASTTLRGLPYLSIPTSLLAMVDAAIGGKTGVNTVHGKNLIGCFYPPQAIYIDPYFLKTLPTEELREGTAEMLKHGLIADAAYFHHLHKQADKILNKDATSLIGAILPSCRIKAHIVSQDEHETKGLRHTLNFGHTVAHALEKVSDYTLSHGKAVGIGLLVEARLSHLLGHLSSEELQTIESALAVYGFKASIPETLASDIILDSMLYDKKREKEELRCILLQKIGLPFPSTPIPPHKMREALLSVYA